MSDKTPGQADLWQLITDVTSELIRGGQTADIRCRAALGVLERAGIDFAGNPVAAAAAQQPQPAPELATAGKTPGQAAYEARLRFDGEPAAWDELDEGGRDAEEAAAQAAIDWQRADAATPTAADFDHAAEFLRYRDALERLADEDTPVLDEGLGGGGTEELHVRTSLAALALGREVLCCSECTISLGLERDI